MFLSMMPRKSIKMRPQNDLTYHDRKEDAEGGFHLMERGLSPSDVSEWLYGQQDEYGDGFTDTIAMLFIISIAEYEVRNNILEERIRNGAAYHIYRYENMGRYKADLSDIEIRELETDIAFIKSKVELPELESYDDREYMYTGK